MERTKFNVARDTTRRTYDGIVFDSEVEMRYYREIVLPQYESGEIVNYELQKRFVLQPSFVHEGKKVLPIVYTADFYLEHKDGKIEVIDIKGFAESDAKLKRKMFWYVFPDLDYRWIGYSKIDGGFVSYESIQSGRKARKRAKEQKD